MGPLELCPKIRTYRKFRHGKSIALSTKLVVVVDSRACWRHLYDDRRVVAVYYKSVNCNPLTPLLRFVVDLSYNLFLQLARLWLTQRVARSLCASRASCSVSYNHSVSVISLLRSETAANSEDNAEVNTEETPDSTGSTIEAAAQMTTAARAELAANATASMHYLLHLHFLQHEKLSHSERLNIIGLQTRVIFDLILCHKYLHGLVNTNNCNFIRICQSRTIEVPKL